MNKDELIARLTLELYEARRNLEATENALRQERGIPGAMRATWRT